ncbi:hypothetical protein [Curtobacterium sp. MCBD17_032]|uniref:hypothetical protein n=1 Tax=Curtobacterium sp. MCBD17_032 TaxID=2175659 RepID=UPI000DA812F6|nr:hypothetical protein [Curtobacterium sp. MCBD17_032]PZE82687.1 hypothetical protein DEI91_10885 [Curtobacterium sp. MCBD17_032]
MSRADRKRDRVIALCEEMAGFMCRMGMQEAQPFYLRQAEALRDEPTYLGRRRTYRTIYSASNTGAGGMSDLHVVKPDGTGDVPTTDAYYRCLHALLRATRTFP